MLIQKLKALANRGWSTAILEVALIFIGITLAIGFENWNSERKERLDELELLTELKSNLSENLQILRRMIAFNESTVDSYNLILSHLNERKPYSDDLAPHFAIIDNWASPYLTSSAYETLKGRGLDLVSETELRRQVVNLFEHNYVSLVNDDDRVEWINNEVSIIPLMLRHFEDRSIEMSVPLDYDSLLDDRAFMVAVKRTIIIRSDGIKYLRESVVETEQVMSSISEYINR